MREAWRDGIGAMMRAAERGSEIALTEDEEEVVKSFLITVFAAIGGRSG